MDDIFVKFRGKFIDEVHELVKKLEASLISLETNFNDKAAIEEVFRFAHTLKGVSGMYGFVKIEEYTHKLENLFESIRTGKLKVSTEIIDLTLQSADHVNNLLDDFEFQQPANIEKQAWLMHKIMQLDGNDMPEKPNEMSTKKTKPSGLTTYYIYFFPDEQIIFRGINITRVFRELAELGTFEIFKHQPNVIIDTKNSDQDGWGIILSTKSSIEDVQDVFMFLEDNCKIYKIANEDLLEATQKLETTEALPPKVELHIEDLASLNNSEIIQIIQPSEEVVLNEEKPVAENNVINEKKPIIAETVNIKSSSFISKSISIDLEKLDNLMYLVSELVTNSAQLKLSFAVKVQENILSFQRLIRDLSHSLNKKIKFEIEGGETELDKSIIDKLTEPLMHLVRNSIDHGIETPEERTKQHKPETGTIKFSVLQEGNSIIITISDDGRGINTENIVKKAIANKFIPADAKLTEEEKFNLIFMPGLSTAESLTQVSGRGVGMDIVKNKLNELGAHITIHSKTQVGTTFTIKLQQNTAIIDTLLFKSGESYFLLPVTDIKVCLIFNQREFESYRFKGLMPYNDQLISYIDLYQLFNIKQTEKRNVKLIVINREGFLYAIAVDNILGEHQAVLKALDKQLSYRDYIAGVSVLADGNMAFLLDTNALKNQTVLNPAV